MVKKIVILILISAYSAKVCSQNFSFGLKSGFNIVDVINATNNIKLPSKGSYHLELFGNYQINKLFQLQIEPGFIEKGSWATSSKEWREKYGYITCPFLLIARPIKRVNIEIGSEFNYLIYAKLKSPDGKLSEHPQREYFYEFEISGVLGISYNYLKNNQFGMRLSRGLTQIWDSSQFMFPYNPPKFYNRYIEFFLRFPLFYLHKKENAT
jgi:hypothetical protein